MSLASLIQKPTSNPDPVEEQQRQVRRQQEKLKKDAAKIRKAFHTVLKSDKAVQTWLEDPHQFNALVEREIYLMALTRYLNGNRKNAA